MCANEWTWYASYADDTCRLELEFAFARGVRSRRILLEPYTTSCPETQRMENNNNKRIRNASSSPTSSSTYKHLDVSHQRRVEQSQLSEYST